MNHTKKFYSILILSLCLGLTFAYADSNNRVQVDGEETFAGEYIADESFEDGFSEEVVAVVSDEVPETDEETLPSEEPSPSLEPSESPSPSAELSPTPSASPSPSMEPSASPSLQPSAEPSEAPSVEPSVAPVLTNGKGVDPTVIVSSDENGVYNALGWNLKGVEGQPYMVGVNRAASVVTVYQKDTQGNYTKPVKAMLCSTGVSGHSTPTGVYKTTERYRWKQLFGAWGQYSIRFAEHMLFHSVPYYTKNPADLEYKHFNKLGSPASSGCIRLAVIDAKWMYDTLPTGFTAIVYEDPDYPGPLGKPENIIMDIEDPRHGWDPTDPDPENPWHNSEG